MSKNEAVAAPRAGAGLNIAIWIAQFLVGVPFIAAGFMKLTGPIPELAASLRWPGDVPEMLVRAMGVVDLLGGVGILLPALTRIKPGLTVAAALGCVALQACAMVFHLSRGEVMMVPVNSIFLLLSLFVAWGRGRKAPIDPR